jgi:hypothetical protein
VTAAEWTALLTVVLLVTAFVLGFRLPRRARESAPSGAEARDSAPSGIDRAPQHGKLDSRPATAAA